jgi:hypothetical protein
MKMDKRLWAMAYAEAGLFVIEIEQGAKPPVSGKGWKTHATNSPEVVGKMFDRNPEANWGACPGPHFVWLDLDIPTDRKPNKPDGRKALAMLEMAEGDLPETFTCLSASGGEHRLYRVPRPVTNANRLPAGIDTRGGFGYVVGPGSELIEGFCDPTDTPGKYEYQSGSLENIADAPEWLIAELRTPGADDPDHDVPLCDWDLPENVALAEEFLSEREPAIEGQGGDGWTTETAMFLRDFGISPERAYVLMETSGWNQSCMPRWEPGELKLKIKNGYRYSENRPGCKRNRIVEMQALRENLTREELYDRFVATPLEKAEKAAQEERLEGVKGHLGRSYFYAGGFMKRGRRREYVIPGWLPAHGMTAILASRGVGKSTILIDLACRIAHGMDWQGIPTMAEPEFLKKMKDQGKNSEPWKVVYLCGEDDEGLELNIVGWHKFYGKEPTDNLIIRDGITNLMNGEDVEAEMAKIKELVGDSRCIIIADTWQRATSMGKQNADDDMNRAIEAAEFMAAKNRGPIIVAFHPPKAAGSQTILGSSFIENATSAIWWLEEVGDGIKMKVTRIKGPGHGNWRKYSKETCDLDTVDVFGNKEVGLIPVKFAGTEEQSTEEGKTTTTQVRRAWATAIRGCYEFPMENNEFEPIKLNRNQIAIFIARMHNEREGDNDAAKFCQRYLHELYAAGVRNLTAPFKSESPYSDGKSGGTIYKALSDEWFDVKTRDDTPVLFGDENNTKLTVVIPEGRTKPVFVIMDDEKRNALAQARRTKTREENKRKKMDEKQNVEKGA